MPPVIFVDFDGVILRNNAASSYVKNRVETLISHVTPLKNREHIQAFNRELYTGHGHTVLGLRRCGFNVTLAEFNNYLYRDTKAYQHLALEDHEKCEWNRFYQNVTEQGYKVRLFSNSAREWMYHFIGRDADDDIFEYHDFIDSLKGEYIYSDMLKPGRNMYDMAMYIYPKTQYFFLDDKICNFEYIYNDIRWNKFWMNPHHTVKLGKAFYSVKSFDDCEKLIDTYANKRT